MVHSSIQSRILPGERIAWTGQPGHGLHVVPGDMFLIPFSLIWCGFAVFCTFSAAKMGAPVFFLLWGMMFVCIGIYFVIGRFIVDAWIRRGMHYAVTDRRILIARSAPFSKFTAVNLAQLPDIDLSERADGRGTIRFGPALPLWGRKTNMSPSLDPTPQFIAIEGARRVFDLVQRLIQKTS